MVNVVRHDLIKIQVENMAAFLERAVVEFGGDEPED